MQAVRKSSIRGRHFTAAKSPTLKTPDHSVFGHVPKYAPFDSRTLDFQIWQFINCEMACLGGAIHNCLYWAGGIAKYLKLKTNIIYVSHPSVVLKIVPPTIIVPTQAQIMGSFMALILLIIFTCNLSRIKG